MTSPHDLGAPPRHSLLVLAPRLAICRLDAGEPVPTWAWAGEFGSVTRTRDEVSVVCPEAAVPPGVRADRGWRALRLAGTQDLSLVGVLAGLVAPIAAVGASVFALATFDTDYLLVPDDTLPRVVAALEAAGHTVEVDRADLKTRA